MILKVPWFYDYAQFLRVNFAKISTSMDMNTSASIVANLGLQTVMFITAKNMFLGSGSYFGFCNRDIYSWLCKTEYCTNIASSASYWESAC